MATPEPWHLDKRVPVALIVTILMQTGAAVWFASAMNERVNRLQAQQIQIVADATSRETRIRALELGAGRTEEKLIGIQSTLGRIEELLEDLRP